MEKIKIEKLSFTYPNTEKAALCGIDLSINEGEFVVLCGSSGGGKTTLLRHLKPTYTPSGKRSGRILFCGRDINELTKREEAEKIGFVGQNPNNSVVCDKVWHELAFGAESLGWDNGKIRTRVAETAAFFGIDEWLHQKTSELSGGRIQLLNLASVMIMNPSLLILDEPTSQLDPIAAGDFLNAVSRINKELGVTVVMSEHRCEEVFPLADRVIVAEDGKIVANDTPRRISCDPFYLPTPTRIFRCAEEGEIAPITVCEGREWLKNKELTACRFEEKKRICAEAAAELDEVRFSYEKNSPDILKGLSAKIYKNEIYAIVGGNGVGKTTLLSVISGINKPYSGKVKINGTTAAVPQNPELLFLHGSVEAELADCDDKESLLALCELEGKETVHPYDLSGGEKQRLALAIVLSKKPDILILDEPTKGMDAHFKEKLASILKALKKDGTTIILVSHDIEFCAKNADCCAMLFDGVIAAENTPREFFESNSFYTTSAARMAKGIISSAVLEEDIMKALGIQREEKEEISLPKAKERVQKGEKKPKKRKSLTGGLFLIGFLFVQFFLCGKYSGAAEYIIQGISVVLLGFAISCFIARDEISIAPVKRKRMSFLSFVPLVLVPITVLAGVHFFEEYYFVSLCVIFETIAAFVLAFEKRKPSAREIAAVSVLCTLAACGRIAFAPLPQFKPTAAVVIVAGACFGGETGFLVGAVGSFISNFFFGQGPWTPWQMLAFGLTGLSSGLIFQRVKATRIGFTLFGAAATLVVYGAVMNVSTAVLMYRHPTAEQIAVSFLSGLPFDIIHAISTVFFLRFAGENLCERLERMKQKYGLFSKAEE